MQENGYRVIVTGKTLDSKAAEAVIANICAALSVTESQARSLLGQPAIFRQNLDEATAAACVRALRAAGLDAAFEPDADMTDGDAPLPPPLPVLDMMAEAEPIGGARQPGDAAAFLESIGLADLIPLAIKHRLTSTMVRDLSDQDLQSMGIQVLGERKRILAAIGAARKNDDASQLAARHRQLEQAGKAAGDLFGGVCSLIAVLIGVMVGLADSSFLSFLMATGFCYIALWLYFLPSKIAFRKQSEYRWAILVCNFFFGATLVGWIILLVLANRLVSGKAAAALGVVAAITGVIS